MLKEDLILFNQGLNSVAHLSGVKFAYAVSRNLSILKPELESLEKAAKPTDEYMKFEDERIKLVEKFAEKDEKGKAKQVPMVSNPRQTEYVIDKDKQEELDKEFGELKEKHKEAVEGREKQIKEYNELLKSEAPKLEFHKVSIDQVPAQINVTQMHSIREYMVEDNVPSPYNK